MLRARYQRAVLLSILTLVGIVLISSCKSDYKSDIKPQNVDKTTAQTKLLNEINDLTEFQVVQNGDKTRGFWSFFFTAAADALGALLPGGNIASGVAASSLAWNISEGKKKETKTAAASVDEPDLRSVFLNEKASEQFGKDDPGYIHNEVIKRAYRENGGEEFFKLSDEEQVKILCRYTKEVMMEVNPFRPIPEIDAQKALFLARKISGSIQPGMTIDELAASLKAENTDKSFQYGVDVVMSVVNGLENSDSGQEEYIKSVRAAIVSSEIDSQLKERLSVAISIAYASTNLWNVESLYYQMKK